MGIGDWASEDRGRENKRMPPAPFRFTHPRPSSCLALVAIPAGLSTLRHNALVERISLLLILIKANR